MLFGNLQFYDRDCQTLSAHFRPVKVFWSSTSQMRLVNKMRGEFLNLWVAYLNK